MSRSPSPEPRAGSPPKSRGALKTPKSSSQQSRKGRVNITSFAAEAIAQGSYAERTIWSSRFKGWARYYVKKPRLPVEADKARWVDLPKYKPSSFKGVSGTHNTTIIRSLMNFVGNFESLKSLQDLTIIHGPSGSGKSMLAYIYTVELAETMDLGNASFSKWTMAISATDYDENHGHEMIARISKFIEPKLEKAVSVAFRVIIIDNADQISHSNQTTLKKLMDSNLMRLKWIFTCSNVKNLIGGFQTKGLLLQTKGASEKDSLLIILTILQRNRIGYERLALKTLFDLHRPMLSLSKMLDVLQSTFLRFHFVSSENVKRTMGAPEGRKEVSPFAAIGEPLARCKICTLVPPCAHSTLDFLLGRSQGIRDRLPRRGPGYMVCPSFAATGCCQIFNKYGRCSLDHPTTMHSIREARRVCPQCTVLWPCNHCKYSVERRKLQKLIEYVQRRLQLLEEINQPDPPAYLIRKLVDAYDDWMELIAGLARFYITKEKDAVMKETVRWLNTSYSADMREYITKQQTLARTYGEVIRSPLLVEPTFSRAGSGGGRRKASGDAFDEDSVGSMGSFGSLGSLDSKEGSPNSSPGRSPSP